jgi:hypothetical protein
MANPVTAQAKWTVMVYMAAGDDAELDAHAVSDLQEMERAGVGSDINVVVQIDRYWPARGQRYRIDGNGAELLDANVVTPPDPKEPVRSMPRGRAAARSLNMGSGATLKAFFDWVLEHHPADRYALVLWGHAYGLGFGRDHGDPMTLTELRGAIEHFAGQLPPDAERKERKLDLLGANACAMSYIEAACELNGCVDFIAASQVGVPFTGWPYQSILGGLTGAMTTEAFGRLIVDRYVAQFGASPKGQHRAMSLLNLQRAKTIARPFADFAQAVNDVVCGTGANATTARAHVRSAFLATAAGDVRPLLDLYDLCEELIGVSLDLKVLAADPSLDALERCARIVQGEVNPLKAEPMVFTHAGTGTEGLHGLGVFAPFVTADADLKRLGLADGVPEGRTEYEQLNLVKQTRWPSLVFDGLRSGLPTDVVTAIEGSGASSRGDRTAVAQMLVSVDSVFDVLDRRIAATTAKVLAAMPEKMTAEERLAARRPEVVAPLGVLQLLRQTALEKALAPPAVPAVMTATAGGGQAQQSSAASQTPTQSPSVTPPGSIADAASAFKSFEATLADMEATLRRTLTNGTFGLGPALGAGERKPDLGAGEHKADLGAGERKPDLGVDQDNPGLASGPKSGNLDAGERKPDLGPAVQVTEPSAGTVTMSLFGQVAKSMQALEQATTEAETVAALGLLGSATSPALEPLLTGAKTRGQVERAFRTLAEASNEARRTLRRVVSHPAYGFGPGDTALDVESRRALARASGLNSTTLALL